MTNTPSRFGAIALTLAVGFGLGTFFHGRHSQTAFLPSANAQTVADAPSAIDANNNGPVPVASVAPVSADKALDASIAPRDSKGRHMAPHDTFYLLEYVSAKTDKGVEGFEPGQEVHLVEVHRQTQTLVVTDGRAQVEVEPSKLTNNLDVAALVRQKDQSNQARIAAYVQSEREAYNKAQKEAAEATSKDLDRVNHEKVVESRVGNDTQLNQPERQVDASYGGNGYGNGNGYYGYGNYGYGSPYSYFGGDNNQAATTAAAAAAASTAKAPATAPAVGGPISGGGKVGVPSGGSGAGRPK